MTSLSSFPFYRKKCRKKLNENKSRSDMAMSTFLFFFNFFRCAPTTNSQLIHYWDLYLPKSDLKTMCKKFRRSDKCNNEVFEEIACAICRNDSHFSIAKAHAFTLKHFILRSTIIIKLGMTSEEEKMKTKKNF